jgi:hypothetical protein
MAFVVLGGVRSKGRGKSKRPAVRPSIREVCLVGIGVGAEAGARAVARPAPEGEWASGGRVTWSGRAYRVEATQARAGGSDGPLRYVHLAALAEG